MELHSILFSRERERERERESGEIMSGSIWSFEEKRKPDSSTTLMLHLKMRVRG
jgi:hypothetical protein